MSDITVHHNVLLRYESTEIYDTIEDPVILMETLDSCYSHALIDRCFPIFWIINELNLDPKRVRIMISSNLMLKYPNNLRAISPTGSTYNGAYSEIIQLLTQKPIIFQHLIRKSVLLRTLYVYPEHDLWQRSPWNCMENYSPQRPIRRSDVRYTDEVIGGMLHRFRQHVFSTCGVSPHIEARNAIIIERIKKRQFSPTMLNTLVSELSANTAWTFQGVKILEDMSLKEQVALFASSKIIIARHGSGLTNTLWCGPDTIIIDIGGGKDGVNYPIPMRRIAQFTRAKHIYLNYDTYDIRTDIITNLVNISSEQHPTQ
jgi:hypothetical protein